MPRLSPEEVERRVKNAGDELRRELGLSVCIIVGSFPDERGTFIAGNGDRRTLRAIEKVVTRRGVRRQ